MTTGLRNIKGEPIAFSCMIAFQKNQKNPGLRKERSRWEIIRDMLTVLAEEKKVKKTRMMQRACLDWRNFQKYYDYLLIEGFIAQYNNPDKGGLIITEKGSVLLKKLKDVDDILH